MFSLRQMTFSALMATFMSILIGTAITLIRSGADGFWQGFLSTAPIAFGVALPVGIFVTPLAQRIVTLIFGEEKKDAQA